MRSFALGPLLGPLLCARHAPPVCVADDGWRFTSIRPDDSPQSEPLPVLVEAFAPPLWVGEVGGITVTGHSPQAKTGPQASQQCSSARIVRACARARTQ